MCARRVADVLHVTPADVPVEGYYTEDQQLTEYFRLLRALQEVDECRTAEVAALPEFRRLQEVTSARIYGHPRQREKLLSVGRDAVSQALIATAPNWTLARLVAAAHACARETDDFSLVGLAARIQDAVVLTALRESVVLYAEYECLSAQPRRQYLWKVSDELAEQARRFIDAFNALFGENLPPPEPAQAVEYWDACEANNILGRCVRLGWDDIREPVRHYHWAIYRGPEGLTVQEFWHPEVWTTTRYREALHVYGRCPDL